MIKVVVNVINSTDKKETYKMVYQMFHSFLLVTVCSLLINIAINFD